MGSRLSTPLLPAAIFFLSGCASLIFEALCARKLALALGSTVVSSSATVAAFLLGLGLGSYLAGRFAPRAGNLIATFALLELAAGLGCLVVLEAVAALPALITRFPQLSPSLVGLLCALLLLPPCILMGASLPVLCLFYARQDRERFLPTVAGLYAINTLGATLGVLLPDFFLITRIGVRNTGLVAALLYLLVAVLAGLGARGLVDTGGGSTPETEEEPRGEGDLAGEGWIACFALVASGLCGLAYQVLWTRSLTFFNGNDVFAFSMTLAVYLFGIFLGSLILGVLRPAARHSRQFLGICLAALSLSGYGSLFAAGLVRSARDLLFAQGVRDPWLSLAGCLIVVGPSAIVLGLLFPLATQMLRRSVPSSSAAVGQAYLANSCGSACGALIAGLLLLPRLGMQSSWMLASATTMLMAVVVLWPTRRGVACSLSLAGLLAMVMLLTPRDRLLRILYEKRLDTILFQADDHYGSVAFARRWSPTRQQDTEILYVDDFNMAGNDVVAQRYTTCLSALAVLLHPAPRDVLIICLGLGNTTNAALQLEETQRVEVVELSDKVVQALRLTSHGPGILGHPKFQLTMGDGRNHLLRTERLYDVISAEPPPPMNAGVVNLYSREYYELCRSRLKPGGIAVQWLPVFEMSPFEAKIIIKAFQDVFPNTYLWQGGGLQLVLLGSTEPIPVDLSQLESRVESNRAFLQEKGLADPYKLTAMLLADPQTLREYTRDVPPLTDDWPRIQYPDLDWRPDVSFFFFQPRPLEVLARPHDAAPLEAARKAENAFRYFTDGKVMGVGELARRDLGRTYLEKYPEDKFALAVAQGLPGWGRLVRERATQQPGELKAWQELARFHFLRSEYGQAAAAAEQAIVLSSGSEDLSHLMLPLILLRGGLAGEIPDGAARARKSLAQLQARGLPESLRPELEYLEWLLEPRSSDLPEKPSADG